MSTKGGRPPGTKVGAAQRTLDKDRERKALARAKKAGFATVEEHRADTDAKIAKRDAENAAKPKGIPFIEQKKSERAEAKRIVAERAARAALGNQNPYEMERDLGNGRFTTAARRHEYTPSRYPVDAVLNPHMPDGPPPPGFFGGQVPGMSLDDTAKACAALPAKPGFTVVGEMGRAWYVPIQGARREESLRGPDGVLRFNTNDSVSVDAETAEQIMRDRSDPLGGSPDPTGTGFLRACQIRNSEYTDGGRDPKDRRWW
jgi:hypothetical protein